MRTRKSKLAIVILAILAVTLVVSSAFSALVASVVLTNTGQISLGSHARSGSARDIQAAVDWVAGHGGRGTVYIPEGTWNFVEAGEPWQTVTVPAGINITGAPTERDANGQVTAWKTILVVPNEVPSANNPDDLPTWFGVSGNENPNTPFRFSDIALIGTRYFNHSSTNMFCGVGIANVFNFRIDHCKFQDICGSAIWAGDDNGGTGSFQYTPETSCGVVDHCILNNTNGYPGFADYDARTLGYGIGLRKWACNIWESVQHVWGKYTNYTVFIEDCYFRNWRHVVCSNDGYHYVFRYNIVDDDVGAAGGEVDGHGSYAEDTHPQAVGTRCVEVYNNIFENPDYTYAYEISGHVWALNIRGGSWLVFNNTFIGYTDALEFNNDWGNYAPYRPDCAVNQTYVWNNTLNGANMIFYNADSTQNVNYFFRAPNMQQDGLTYTPYTYPFPLASGSNP